MSTAQKSLLAFRIEVVRGPHSGQRFAFDKTKVSIGRGTENDIVLADDPKVSRVHAEIVFEGAQVIVRNLTQKNYVLIKGRRIQEQNIEIGDKIFIGDSELILAFDGALGKPTSPVQLVPSTQPRSTLSSKVKNTAGPANVAANPSAHPAVQKPRPVVTSQPLEAASPLRAPMNTSSSGGLQPQPNFQVAPQNFGAPPFGGPPGSPRPMKASPGPSSQNAGRLRFYIIVAAVLIGLYLFLSSGTKKKRQDAGFGPSESIQQEILRADDTVKKLEEEKSKRDNQQARRAQENFLKGFRDFRQGQFARARDSFLVVLTIDPQHEEARRYLTLAKLKFDEQVKQNLQRGRIYFENKNYRLCKANFLNVMTLLSQTPNDPSYAEAKKLYDICDLAQGGL